MKRLVNASRVYKNKYDLPPEQFEFYANPEFHGGQREEIAWGFRNGLTLEDAKKYLKPSMTSYEMYLVLEMMLNKNITKKVFELYQRDPNLASLIIEGIAGKSQNRYMSDDNFDQVMKIINTNKFNEGQLKRFIWLICYERYSGSQIDRLISDEDYLNEIANSREIDVVDKVRAFFDNKTASLRRHFIK